ncbi:MAG TPA: GH92 family glycosyl hydrolase [Puia sp.]|nr:GH92 family glycosyl hydrolase [Puia sp.]
MKTGTIRMLFFLTVFMAAIAGTARAQPLTTFVDPLIGSGGHGHVFVGASVPFGAVQLGPDNFYKGWDWCSGYNYGDSMVTGFAHTHLSGTGIGDLGDILIMPYTGAIKTGKGLEKEPGSGYASHYSHTTEKARPGYYAVTLDDYGIKVELTATERVGFHQYHFPAGKEAHVIIDLKEGINDKATDTYIEQVDAYTLKGWRRSKGWAKDQLLFFAIRLSGPATQFKVYENDTLLDGRSGKGNAIKGLISFAQAPSTLKLKCGISPVSPENALANITAEIPHWNFQAIVTAADKKWNKELSKINIETKNQQDKKIFYTAFYHTMIDPALFNDHNGDYRGADKKVYRHAPFSNYTVFSLWDTYRALHPLYTLTQPERVNDMVNTMLAIYRQQGRLPIWHLMGNETGTMVGISSLQVIAEAYMKGFRGFDTAAAFDAVKNTAMGDSLGLFYLKQGKPIPANIQSRSVAKALEYAVADASIAAMAKQMGRQRDDVYFLKRSGDYQLYFDTATRFFRGRLADGSWNPLFDPLKSYRPWAADYAEGNAWQYLWLVPQDPEGLSRLLGGKQAFITRLDSFFALTSPPDTNALGDLTGLIGQYAHGNEPSHHIAYLYTYMGQPWKTAEKVRTILKEMYHDLPDGIIGNEDCGQMSAWYIFSSLGFYPLLPASGKYMIGSPLFDKATIKLAPNKQLVIETVNNSDKNIYIRKIEWNGRPYTKNYLLHSDLIKGGILRFTMSNQPQIIL